MDTLSDALTCAYLSTLLSTPLTHASTVRIRVLEQSCVADVDVQDASPGSRHIIVKRASVDALRRVFPKKTDEAFSVNERSFAAECAWASTAPTRALSAAGARVPLSLGALRTPDGVFTTAQERLVGSEVRQFDSAHARATLRWLASFHAYFYAHPLERDRIVEAGAFDVGGGWSRAAHRPAVDYSRAGDVFREHCADISAYRQLAFTEADAALVDGLGASARARHEAAASRGVGSARTLVHGDFKASNCFFDDDVVVAAFDFQWVSRAGDGASDVAYVLAGAVVYDAIAGSGADDLVAEYERALRERLVAWGCADAEELVASVAARVEEELVCFWATALVYLLRRLNEALAEENKNKYGWLTVEEDTRVTAWLAERAVRWLRRESAAGEPRLWRDAE